MTLGILCDHGCKAEEYRCRWPRDLGRFVVDAIIPRSPVADGNSIDGEKVRRAKGHAKRLLSEAEN